LQTCCFEGALPPLGVEPLEDPDVALIKFGNCMLAPRPADEQRVRIAADDPGGVAGPRFDSENTVAAAEIDDHGTGQVRQHAADDTKAAGMVLAADIRFIGSGAFESQRSVDEMSLPTRLMN